MMKDCICTTCGTQFAPTEAPPTHCPICEDQRQYVGWNGQDWTSLAALRDTHHNVIKAIDPGLAGMGTEPSFAIHQRALLVQTPHGNVLLDCISLIDDPTAAAMAKLGGIALIPLPPGTIREIVAAVEPFDFYRIYGGWWGRIVAQDAKQAVARSATRCIGAVEGRVH